MHIEDYTEIQSFLCRDGIRFPTFKELQTCFPNVPYLTLRSIFAATRQRQLKWSVSELKSPYKSQKHWDWYEAQCAKGSNHTGFVVDFAAEIDAPPLYLARALIQCFLLNQPSCSSSTVAEILKDPAIIPDPVLSREIWLCVLSDDVFGPIPEALKTSSGLEYEALLRSKLSESGIPFVDEEQLRLRGSDKTPDVKLEPPALLLPPSGIPARPKIINWIESKATFGDFENHQQYLSDQYSTYVNRYGPGLVIYWFDFIEELKTDSTSDVLICSSFPQTLVAMTQFYNGHPAKFPSSRNL